MVAKPGTAWTKKFLFCRNSEVEVPVKGRECIPSLGSYFGRRFFLLGQSMEGLEVLMVYGYKLQAHAIEAMCADFVIEEEELQYLLPKLRLCLAAAGSNIISKINLDRSLDLVTKQETNT
jgi:hypothetical protein